MCALHSQAQRGVGERQEAIDPVGTPDHLGAGLRAALAPPAVPADGRPPAGRARPWQAIRRRPGEEPQGNPPMPPPGARALRRRRPHGPRRRRVLATAGLDAAAGVRLITGRPRRGDRRVGPAAGCPSRPIVPPRPRAPHHGVEQMGGEVSAVGLAPRRGRAIRVSGRPPGQAHDRRLAPGGRGRVTRPVPARMDPTACRKTRSGCGLGPGVHGPGPA